MRIETNEKLVRRNRQIAQYLFFVTFAVLIGGLFIINQQTASTEDTFSFIVIAQALLLPVAFISTIISVRMTNQWVRVPRPENVIREGLKGISTRSVLYNYYHNPARHLLVTPQGVFVIITRYHDGKFIVEDDKWRANRTLLLRIVNLLRFDGLGNPMADVQRAVAHAQKLIHAIEPNVEIHPIIVFTDPRASVEVISSSVPVVYYNGKKTIPLKETIKDYSTADKRDPLTPDQIAAFEATTLSL